MWFFHVFGRICGRTGEHERGKTKMQVGLKHFLMLLIASSSSRSEMLEICHANRNKCSTWNRGKSQEAFAKCVRSAQHVSFNRIRNHDCLQSNPRNAWADKTRNRSQDPWCWDRRHSWTQQGWRNPGQGKIHDSRIFEQARGQCWSDDGRWISPDGRSWTLRRGRDALLWRTAKGGFETLWNQFVPCFHGRDNWEASGSEGSSNFWKAGSGIMLNSCFRRIASPNNSGDLMNHTCLANYSEVIIHK